VADDGSASTRLSVCVLGSQGARDLELELVDSSVTLHDVLDAVGLPSDVVQVDDEAPVVAASVCAADVLHSGALISAGAVQTQRRARYAAPDLEGRPLVEIAHVAGVDAGQVCDVSAGNYQLGGAGELVGALSAEAQPSWYLAIREEHPASARRRPWHERSTSIEAVGVPGGVLALSQPIDTESGYIGFVRRPPRHVARAEIGPIEIQAVPPVPNPPQPLSWATFLAPIPIGIIMALFFSPIFAIFAALGPAVALGRWIEGRRRHKRETRDRRQHLDTVAVELDRLIADQLEEVAQVRWAVAPHVAELWRRARHASVRLWERRPGEAGYLCVTVGVGPAAVMPVLAGAKPDPEAHQAATVAHRSRAVPHLLDLAKDHGVGIWGRRPHVVGLARSVVMQLAALQGPADVSIGLLCPTGRSDDWDFLKWLPHCRTDLVSDDAAAIAASLDTSTGTARHGLATARPPALRTELDAERAVIVLVVDDPAADCARLARAAQQADVDLRFVALAQTPTTLPSVCTSLVEAAGTRVRLSTPGGTADDLDLCGVGISLSTAASWARSLAPLRDPEAPELERRDGGAVSLSAINGVMDQEAVGRRWHQPVATARPRANIGVGDEGPIAIDLATDGPHALVAGTTGSGKSEFLRTLVMSLASECSPEHLNFVLIDFKGGGAFDVCSELPHVAGLITDLDEHLVARALTSLRAELHRREQLFRDLGVSAFEQAAARAVEPLARLVIVIDEFAALATDYAELMNAIIDLAARGRSLGMHLILATQRPSGVVDQKIRANTNLRLALRVQDTFDSQDVIGVPDAALIDRRRPGRAIMSIGGDRPVPLQTAYCGAPDRRGQRCIAAPFKLFADVSSVEPGASQSTEAVPLTEIRALLDVIEGASAAIRHRARPLWADPLPESLDWIDLGTRVLSSSDQTVDSFALGLTDIPEQQAQLPWRWRADAGAVQPNRRTCT